MNNASILLLIQLFTNLVLIFKYSLPLYYHKVINFKSDKYDYLVGVLKWVIIFIW